MPAPIERNRDNEFGSPEAVAAGPRLGFLGAWEASYEAQQRTGSVLGLETSFREVEQEQIRTLREAGLTPPPSLNDEEEGEYFAGSATAGGRRYRSAARYFVDGGTPEDAKLIGERDAALQELRKQRPDVPIRTYSEMFGEVQQRAQFIDRRWGRSDTTVGGMIGGFLGGTAASMSPTTDPLNAATFMLGGVGKTVALRMASQVGAQGVVEMLDQLTGVQENRRLLGLSHGFREGAMAVAGTMLGAGVLQGGGELLAAAGRRWFRSTPADPAPPPPEPEIRTRPLLLTDQRVPRVMSDESGGRQLDLPLPGGGGKSLERPYGSSRLAALREQEDLAAVTQQLDAFAGPSPAEVQPLLDMPLPRAVRPEIEQRAREIDPEAFRLYDPLALEAETLRRQIATVTEAGVQVSDVPPPAGAQQARSAQVVPEAVQARLTKLEQKMEELAPVVERARAAAQGKWPEPAAPRGRDSRGQFVPPTGNERALPAPRSVQEEQLSRVRYNPEAIAALPADADAAVRVAATVEAETKIVDEAVERFRKAARAAVPDPGAKVEAEPGVNPNEIIVNGRALDLEKDRIATGQMDEQGQPITMSLRQFMDSIKKDEELLEAAGSCSIRS